MLSLSLACRTSLIVSSTLVAAPGGAFDLYMEFFRAAGAAQVVGLAQPLDRPAVLLVVGYRVVLGVQFDGSAFLRVGDVASPRRRR